MDTMSFTISGMHCAACALSIEKSVKKVTGVNTVNVNLLLNTMEVTGNATSEKIIAAVEKAGYTATLNTHSQYITNSMAQPKNDKNNKICNNATKLKQRLKNNNKNLNCTTLIVQILFLIAIIIINIITSKNDNFVFRVFNGSVIFAHKINNINLTIAMQIITGVLSLIVIIIDKNYFTSGFKALIARSPNMDTLITLGATVSFVWSIHNLVQNIISNDSVMLKMYFQSATMILTFVSIGKFLENISKTKTTDTLKSLAAIAPKIATALVDGLKKSVPCDTLKNGDIIIPITGDAIAADGILLEGTVLVDESMLTGESVAVIKNAGDSLTGGTIVLSVKDDPLIKVTATGVDTVLSKIIETVARTSSQKAPIQRVADRAAAVFVPAVIIISVLTFIIHLAMGSTMDIALNHAIAVLVVSCPCALGLATPCAIMVASGSAAKIGIVFKTATALETLGKVKVIALDKTGTITNGVVGDDKIRTDSTKAISLLKSLGLTTVMISGDKDIIAREVASKVGVDSYYSAVTVNGKKDIIEKLQTSTACHHTLVAMVGDGVNDSVALTASDVGVSIAAARDVAISASGVILMRNSLMSLVEAINISRDTMKIIKENLFWAVFYNAIMIPSAAGVPFLFHITPGIAALTMSLSSICVVLNALRLGRKK